MEKTAARVLAHAAIRYGADGYFGYPITPQSEVLETLEELMPCRATGMVYPCKAERRVSAINMVYGGASAGKAVLTSSSSPGVSLMQEGISYIAAGELPTLIINVMRGGPGLGTIQPSQGDYFQATKGGGHGDYHLIVTAPATVQEMADFTLKTRLRPCLQIPHPGHDHGRRRCRPDDGESQAPAPASAPHRRGNRPPVSVGRQRPYRLARPPQRHDDSRAQAAWRRTTNASRKHTAR